MTDRSTSPEAGLAGVAAAIASTASSGLPWDWALALGYFAFYAPYSSLVKDDQHRRARGS